MSMTMQQQPVPLSSPSILSSKPGSSAGAAAASTSAAGAAAGAGAAGKKGTSALHGRRAEVRPLVSSSQRRSKHVLSDWSPRAQLSSAYASLASELTSTECKQVGGYTLGRVIGEGPSALPSPLTSALQY